jgi:hypothetical protein
MIFFWAFGAPVSLAEVFTFTGTLQKVPAKVIETNGTNSYVNNQQVYAYIYQFEYNGRVYEGVSYDTYRDIPPDRPVEVEFPKNNPVKSRIAGMDFSMMPWWVGLFVLIFPGVGLIFIIVSIRSGIKGNQLLRNGQLAYGKYVREEPTNTRINNMPVMKYFFEFTDWQNRTHEATASTHLPYKLLDEEYEPLLYMPHNPQYAVLMDNLPGNPRISERGQLEYEGNAFTVLLLLIAPGIAILVNVIGAYLTYFV